ncbi:MAG: TetR family transcriptional regulator [Novosphingobium sp.]|nr:MAG: TetR family transcriptional regulator [Novosphingobium sp.]
MRIVDHEQRRQKIAEVAMDLIAHEGLEATTLNRIARQMGASIRVITHYFADKDTLLLAVYRILALQGQAPIAEVLARDPADLAGALNVLCGSDEATLKRWRVYVAFWDKAARSPRFAAEQRLWIEKTLALIGEVIVARTGSAGEIRPLAMELISLVYGMSVQRTLDPESWAPEAIAAVIDRKVREVDLLRPS